MALSCFDYDSFLFKGFQMHKSLILHITVFNEVSEYKTLNIFTFLLHMLYAILICSQHCAREKLFNLVDIFGKTKIACLRQPVQHFCM